MLGAFALVVLSACMHAGWNLIAHRERGSPSLLLHIPLLVGLFGLLPAAAVELHDPLLSPGILGLLALTGAAQAIYYLGLLRAYASEDFSLVYPLSRALPVLLLMLFDLARGRGLTAFAIIGMLLVGAGCVLAPRARLPASPVSRPRGTALWLAVITAATVGYTVVDKIALETLPPRASVALRYSVWEALATLPFLVALAPTIPRDQPSRSAPKTWRWSLWAAAFSFGSYALVLCAYQLSEHTSYVAALRQMSIPLGVAASRALLGERMTGARAAGALLIAAGVACVLAGGR